jgi:hypothetical protein
MDDSAHDRPEQNQQLKQMPPRRGRVFELFDRSAAEFLPTLGPGQAVIMGVDFPIPLTVQVASPESKVPEAQRGLRCECGSSSPGVARCQTSQRAKPLRPTCFREPALRTQALWGE